MNVFIRQLTGIRFVAAALLHGGVVGIDPAMSQVQVATEAPGRSPEEVEEERRLFYVALTRAQPIG